MQAGGGERERSAGARLAAVVVDLGLEPGDLRLQAGGGALQLPEGGGIALLADRGVVLPRST